MQYYGVPLTIPLTVDKAGWLPLTAQFDGDSIDLAIDCRDGYLSAFREGGGGVWAQQEPPCTIFSDIEPNNFGDGAKRKLSLESSALVKGNL